MMEFDPQTGVVTLVPYGGDLQIMLSFMQRHGSSVVLTWGEDNETWECSWISDGKRITAFASEALLAARECLVQARLSR